MYEKRKDPRQEDAERNIRAVLKTSFRKFRISSVDVVDKTPESLKFQVDIDLSSGPEKGSEWEDEFDRSMERFEKVLKPKIKAKRISVIAHENGMSVNIGWK